MKRALCLAFCVLLVLSFTGCRDKPPAKTFEMPTAASPPNVMTTDEILYIVNELLGYEDENKKRFMREDAEVFNVPVPPEGTEVLYLFLLGNLEVGLFADSEKDRILSAYVRALFDDPTVAVHMMSFAGAFLAALEPNEYEKMLSSAMPASVEDLDKSEAAFGEFWRVLYARNLVTIISREWLNNSSVQESND